MSRVGKKIITIPNGVQAAATNTELSVKGPKGSLRKALHPHVRVAVKDGAITVSVADPEVMRDRALWGLFGSLAQNMVHGVVHGFEKMLEVSGVGFKSAVKGKNLELSLGFSHPVVFPIPEGIAISVEKEGIKVSGIDKEIVGETAARIRALKKPEPYKGKGIKYSTETIRRKAGKAAAKAGAAK